MITLLLIFMTIAIVFGVCAIISCAILSLYLARDILKNMKDINIKV